MKNNALTVPEREETLSGEQLSHKLRELLIAYTNGRSSSVDVDIAERISQSLRYTLDVGIRTGATGDVAALYDAGRRHLGTLLHKTRALWQKALDTSIPFGTLTYYWTQEDAIGHFLKSYDPDYAAHITMPLSDELDYPLAVHGAAGSTGVLYIEQYLRILCLENDILNRFPVSRVKAFLTRYNAQNNIHYKHLLINMFTVVCDSALFCTLAGESALRLLLPREQAARTADRLRRLPPDDLRREFDTAVETFMEELGVADVPLRDYVARYARQLFPLLVEALEQGDLRTLIVWSEPVGDIPTPSTTVVREGKKLTDRQLGDLAQAVMDCDDVDRKFALMRSSTARMQDFIDLLGTDCLFGDEYDRLFAGMDPLERTLLAKAVFGEYDTPTITATPWKQALWDAVKSEK